MKRVFISYASKDRDFATLLGKRLGAHYEIFLDFSGISGGFEWEARIQDGIRESDVVVIVVTEASSQSAWVARETLFAESLSKPRIPVLLSGDMPFRLIHLQYVDFRGELEAGLADLTEALKEHAAPQPRSEHEADLLVASAVRARLNGDWLTAENLVKQAVALDPALLTPDQDLWRCLQRSTPLVPARGSYASFELVEATEELDEEIYKERLAYRWSVRLEGPAGFLETVDRVEYRLHPTYKLRKQIVRARQNGFMLTQVGWGNFTIQVKVVFLDGCVLEVPYFLTFQKENRERISLP